MKRTTVLLLFGGESSEHEVSISSARNVFAALDDLKYDVNLCYIDRSGSWWLMDDISGSIDVSGLDRLVPLLGVGELMTVPGGIKIKPDVILPILHGANGEDGTVQGLARLTHIPIVGCKLTSSAIAMDKIITKQLLEYNGIKTVPYVIHSAGDLMPSFAELSHNLGSTLFVKPANGGSSVGISKVSSGEELITAIKDAYNHDDKILIEKAITARELEVAALGSGSSLQISGVGEICPDRDFYSYESKYNPYSSTKLVIPADIPSDLLKEIRDTSKRVYKVIGCKGLARIDFFLSDDGILYLNEINTLPGFTNISMYPKLWQHEGISYGHLIDILIADALEK